MSSERFDMVCTLDDVGFLKAGEGNEMRMFGWASTPNLDADGERVIQEGLDVDPLLKSGWINWNHQSHKIIGIPKVAELRDRGESLGKGLYTEFELLKDHSFAKEVWELSRSLKGTGRSLGLSLEGKKLAVGPKGAIKKAKVMNIALTPTPKNTDTTAEALVKAIVHEEDGASDRFAPILDDSDRDQIIERVEGLVTSAITKALGSGFEIGGTDQKGGAAVRKEEVEGDYADLVAFSEQNAKLLGKLDKSGELHKIGTALVNISGTRGGRLTKAESALYTFLVSEASLTDCFKVFGLGE